MKAFRDLTRGGIGSIRPESRTPQAGAVEVAERILSAYADESVLSWQDGSTIVLVRGVRLADARSRPFSYRALTLRLDEKRHRVVARSHRFESAERLDRAHLRKAISKSRPVTVGSESRRIAALVTASGETPAPGVVEFDWTTFRRPAIDSTTACGWTYKAKLA